jgi:dihydropteroate synthase
MGIVNVTPDSFSDGGNFFRAEDAISHGLRLVAEGADILDIGGESTRPFADPVNADEEIQRVIPVIEALAAQVDVPISVDTTKAQVAREALSAGASMLNDIGALRVEPELGRVAAQFDVPLILMHMQGQPRTMQVDPHYDNLLEEIRQFLAQAIAKARQMGLPESRLIVDPGIGFGKTVAHNMRLIANLDYFHALGVPLLLGTSRKAFIRKTLKSDLYHQTEPPMSAVETGTQATVAASVLSGAHMVRVHDVAATRITCSIVDALRNA